MKALAVGAKDLPWLSPSAASLRALARSPLPAVWHELRTDPGIVLLYARVRGRPIASLRRRSSDVHVLHAALHHLQAHPNAGFVDWSRPECRAVYMGALRQAELASALATLVPGCDPQGAWVAGMLASLGWMTACAISPGVVRRTLDRDSNATAPDQSALARRVSHAWRLRPVLAAISGRLGLAAECAARLGADPVLFPVAQLAVLLQQRDPGAPRITVGAEFDELLTILHLDVEQVERIASGLPPPASIDCWDPPASQPLLGDLLELALRDRGRDDGARVERLHRDIDRLQESLVIRRAETTRQLQGLKVAALAEFAAGAGHEINNPLAVISGQAQYLLRQLDLLDGPIDEIDNPLEYLTNLRGEVVPSLQKIISQTHRIHGILTELMQFARPATPKLQPVELGALLADVRRMLQAFATERRVQMVCDEPATDCILHADPAQVRAALTALLRNAIEAAPAGGWAGVRVEQADADRLAFVVEDSGPGPGPVAAQHLFDPFYSGRSAGRGRGLGLPTAWRLARQQNGELLFDGTHDSVTRFRLILPLLTCEPAAVHANGCNGASHRTS